MAALAGDLSKAIKGQSEAAQAFRPWWDTLEDNLLYGFVILGKSRALRAHTGAPTLFDVNRVDKNEGVDEITTA